MKNLYVSIDILLSSDVYLKPITTINEGCRVIAWLSNKYPSGSYNLLRIDDKYVDEEYIILSFKEDNPVTRIFKQIDQIKEYRNNPVKACEEILGIRLLDYQKDMLEYIMKSPKKNFLHMGRCTGRKYVKELGIKLNEILYKEE